MTPADRKQVAFITGASSGIGKATAELFLRAGYAVALVDVNDTAGKQVQEAFAAIGECHFFQCDVSDDAMVKSAVQACVDRLGPITAAFNAAGIDGDLGKPTAETSPENWHRVIAINLTGVWHCMRHQIPVMLEHGGGTIVNCASVAGLVGAPGLPPYVASKHGVVGLTRTAALEYARQGVRINAVCPGLIDTPMASGSMGPEVQAALVEQSPIGRLGQPAEVGQTVLWLCGEQSSFVTGQAIAVDGAWTVM
ncbi:SDR family oxidoreductase [Mangrovimicrobium sediminis]|uniref:SDR family oxidoreductase n=1 Tax=Mangrovimicrobium sediminis TaxID=2562682 RepID=A0A4Z0M9H1_9GAMM|nr:SDR family oxidoreductase [Haliea sp. SAOS-164]TGD76134.1 SDR family oxidoreductase [Haliea sp. SAOS-164]